jgi:hypothetical protein
MRCERDVSEMVIMIPSFLLIRRFIFPRAEEHSECASRGRGGHAGWTPGFGEIDAAYFTLLCMYLSYLGVTPPPREAPSPGGDDLGGFDSALGLGDKTIDCCSPLINECATWPGLFLALSLSLSPLFLDVGV